LPKYSIVFALWLLLTLININKAFHIDDTFHIEAAKCIAKNPLQPMQCAVNWDDSPTPLFVGNQPPLFLYMVALQITIFGESEIALHSLIALFSFLCLFYFKKIALALKMKDSNLLLALFAFCPAFIINQNVMVDVPLMALLLIATYFLIKGNIHGQLSSFLLAFLILSIAILIKYTALPVVVAFTLFLVLSKHKKRVWVALIPLAVIVLWSFWNYLNFGEIHLFNRAKGNFNAANIITFISCLGAICFIGLLLLNGAWKKTIMANVIYTMLCALLVVAALVYTNVIQQKWVNHLLNVAFVFNGSLIIVLTGWQVLKEVQKNKISFLQSNVFILALVASAIGAFTILFAPFIASRHLLLIVPMLLLLSYPLINQAAANAKMATIIASAVIGLLLGISDWVYADYYRKMANTIQFSPNAKVWSSGHWGWQYYANKNDMETYATNATYMLKPGDYLVYPKDVSKQKIDGSLTLSIENKYWEEAGALTLFSGHSFASMYNSYLYHPAWGISTLPIDTIVVTKVEKNEHRKITPP